MTLDQLKEGDVGLIVGLRGRGVFRRRIMELGFVKGQKIRVLRFAPLQDPIEFRILESEISLRRSEAALIDIELLDDSLKLQSEPQISSIDVTKANCNASDCILRENTSKDAKEVDGSACESCKKSSADKQIDKQINKIIEKSLRSLNIEVCVVGNPNTGKTSLYNALTNEQEKVGNYSGVTVGAKSKHISYKNADINLIDLPGAYSLSPYTPEENFVQEQLLQKKPDIVINVIDASNLERNLYLTTQLIDMDLKVIIALNMYDEFEKSGASLDIDLLAKLLGIPIVPTIASKTEGCDLLLEKIIQVYAEEDKIVRHIHIPYLEDVEKSIRNIQNSIYKDEFYSDIYSSRFLALNFLSDNIEIIRSTDILYDVDAINAIVEQEKHKLESIYKDDNLDLLADSRYAFIKGALKECYKSPPHLSRQQYVTDKIDGILTHKYLGFPIFLAFLWLMFQTTFALGAYPMDWIEQGITFLDTQLRVILSEGLLKDMLLDGVLAGVGGVIIFLPNILILFAFIAFMEASGYMARVAFIMDKLMHTIGLHGKSFIPLIIGFGCNVPAIMATRTIEDKKDRLVTMLIVPFMSCGARLPIYILLVGVFFEDHAGTVLFLIYMAGILFSIFSALLFKKTILKSTESPFVMEMPPYRLPSLRAVFYNLWTKSKQYLQKMGGIILVASIIIWALGYFPLNELGGGANLVDSYLGSIGKFIEPVLQPLGFDWKMSICLLTGVSAKEVVVSTMKIVMDVATAFTPLTAVSFLAFVLLYFPCPAVFSAVKQESESWKWAIFMALYTTISAWIVSFLIYQIGSLFV